MALIYFEDVEIELVTYFSQIFPSSYVATKKAPADLADVPSSQIILTVSPSAQKNPVLRYFGLVVEIYAQTYQEASDLGRMVEMYLRDATSTRSIQKVEIIAGPIRLGEESGVEKRSISADLTVRAWTD